MGRVAFSVEAHEPGDSKVALRTEDFDLTDRGHCAQTLAQLRGRGIDRHRRARLSTIEVERQSATKQRD